MVIRKELKIEILSCELTPLVESAASLRIVLDHHAIPSDEESPDYHLREDEFILIGKIEVIR